MSSIAYHVIKLKFPIHSRAEFTKKLYDLGCLGIIEESGEADFIYLRTYFSAERSLADQQDFLLSQFPQIHIEHATTIALNSAKEQPLNFEPFALTPKYWVYPPLTLHEQPAVIIQPGMAFGTGKHETTQLVATALEKFKNHSGTLLDIGTGSGILAILAAKLGFAKIDAVEIDLSARQNAQENFSLNDAEQIGLYENINQVSQNYDVILANVLTPTILYLQESILAHLNAGGILILSGIVKKELLEIQKAFNRLTLQEVTEKEQWSCLVYEK